MSVNGDVSVKSGSTRMQWIVAILITTTLMTYGLQAGWVSPMRKELQSLNSTVVEQPISDGQITWIASIMPITGVFGVSFYAFLADRYGRRLGVLAIAVPQAICWIIKLITTSFPGLLIARICAGLAAGGCYSLMPLYVKELSQDNIRGLLISLIGLNQNLGFFIIYAMGAFLDYYTVLWIVVWLPLGLIAILVKVPESPAFLVKLGKYDEAISTVAFLRGRECTDKVVINEVEYLKKTDEQYKTLPQISFVKIFKTKPWRKGLLMIMMTIGFQACNGCYSIITYASKILEDAGVVINPELQTLSIPAVMILGSLVTITCVERVGRKVLLTLTFAITIASFLCLATIMLLRHQGSSVPEWVPILAIVAAVWSYAAGVVSVPYVILAEMFNFRIRAKVSGCIVSYGWTMIFLQLFLFIPISNAFGTYTMFYFFAGVNICGFLNALIILPETKGKTVEEIEEILSR